MDAAIRAERTGAVPAWGKKILILLLLAAQVAPVTSAYGGLADPYVRKYRSVGLSAAEVNSVAGYDNLVVYFSSITYFRPRHTVSPDFIRALILAESGGNPKAVSVKNALGLCQILYPTAKAAAGELLEAGGRFNHVSAERLRHLQPEDLFDPAVNILIACYLIAKYNVRYNGRLDLVVSAWNAGEGAILNNCPPRYPETLDLIGRVNGYLLAFLNIRRIRLLAANNR